MKKAVSNKITILNFVCSLFVCYYHFLCAAPQIDPFFNRLSNYLCFIAMSVFFMTSGFLLFQNCETWDDMKVKLRKRVFSLVVPYLIWNTISIVIYWKHNLILDIINKKTFTFSFFELIKHYFTGPINGPTWYLLAIYLISLFTSVIIKMKKRKKTITAMLIVSLLYFYLRNRGIIPTLFRADDWWWFYNLISYSPYYFIGCYIGMYYREIVTEFEPKFYINVLSMILFIILSFFNNLQLLGFLTYFSGFLIIFCLWFSLPNRLFKSDLRPITQTSFFVYVMHIPIINPLINKILKSVLNGARLSFSMSLVISLIIFILAVVICFVILTLLKLIFIKSNKLFMIISGNRVKNDFAIKLENRKNNKAENKQ